MSDPTTTYIVRISQAITTVEERRQVLAQLRSQVEPLARSQVVVVDGEISQLNSLQLLLDSVLAEIKPLQSISNVNDADQRLEKIEDALTDVSWDLVDHISEALQKKAQQQEEIFRQQQEEIQAYAARLTEWSSRLSALKAELDKAAREQAPIRLEQLEFGKLEGLVLTIQRDLQEGRLSNIEKQLTLLDENRSKVTQWLTTIPAATRRTVKFRRQADLLLFRSQLDQNRKLYRYTVMLRTASGPGSHGVNIQERCGLVELDWKEMADVINQVTNAVNRGMTRHLQSQNISATTVNVPPPIPGATTGNGSTSPAAPTEPITVPAPDIAKEEVAAAADATAAAVVEALPDAADPLRKAEFKIGPTSPLGPLYPEGLNDLVKNVGEFMYKCFISHQMQDYLSASPCSLTLSTNDLMLPWELMSYEDRARPGVTKFLCLERPVARMPMRSYYPRIHREHADDVLRFLLIYADPNFADPKKQLQAAKKEVDRIEQKLIEQWGSQVEIVKLSEAQVTGRALNKVLREGNFKVIHFAGHAFFDNEDGELSGLLLHQGEEFLAQKVQRLLEGRPLVFLNACESGTTANEEAPQQTGYMQEAAEGLASAFIYGGARGCVGSLWPIYDDPAADFAIHFYNNVVRGHMIGEALRLARRRIKKDHKDQITWAAYVLYGDPTLRL